MNKIAKLLLTLSLVFGCGGIADTSDKDFRTVEIIYGEGPNGNLITTEIFGEIDTGVWYTEPDSLYGKVEQALNVMPDRFGIYSAADFTANDTRCPPGGVTSGTAYCMLPGTKTYNWDYSRIDTSGDATLGLTAGETHSLFAGAIFELPNSLVIGFSNNIENLPGPVNAVAGWDISNKCPAGSMACTSGSYGGVFTYQGKRVRMESVGTTQIRLSAATMQANIPNNGLAKKRIQIKNIVKHEVGHAMGNGHVPTAENALDIMTLQNGQSDLKKSFSTAEKNRMLGYDPGECGTPSGGPC